MKTFNFEGDVQEIAEFVRAFRMRTFKMKVVVAVISVMFLITGYAVWLPDVQLTDDPLRWILCILLVLAVAVISIVIEVKSIRLLDNIISLNLCCYTACGIRNFVFKLKGFPSAVS